MQFNSYVYVPHPLTSLPSFVLMLCTSSQVSSHEDLGSSQTVSQAYSQDHRGFPLMSPHLSSPPMRSQCRPPPKRPSTSPSSDRDDSPKSNGRTPSKPIDFGVDTMVGRDGMRALPDEIRDKQFTKQQKERNSNHSLCAKKLQLCWQAVHSKVVLI